MKKNKVFVQFFNNNEVFQLEKNELIFIDSISNVVKKVADLLIDDLNLTKKQKEENVKDYIFKFSRLNDLLNEKTKNSHQL